MLYYALNKYQIPEGYTFNSYINEAVENIRNGNDAEYYQDTLFRLTYPNAVKEVNKLSNYAEPTELLPLMSIAFMTTLDKFDPEKANVSFMNYYKVSIRNNVIMAYDKHRGAREENKEYYKRCEKTMRSMEELVPVQKNSMLPLYTMIEDNKALIDENLSYENLIETIFRIIDTKLFTPKQEKTKTIFMSYINACINEEKWDQREVAKKFGTVQSYVCRIKIKYCRKLKEELIREGYVL
ncbi:MAG: sigma-70 family RNA polymerase sigma factor [Clostridium sp.]|nr:sigma-70 family RNA polymerase sigma factor [Clostridium sp.]